MTGDYIERVQITSYTSTQDALGQVVLTDDKTYAVGANIRQISSFENVSGSKETHSVVQSFEFQRTPLTVSIQLTDTITNEAGQVFDITNVDTITMKHWQKVKVIGILRR